MVEFNSSGGRRDTVNLALIEHDDGSVYVTTIGTPEAVSFGINDIVKVDIHDTGMFLYSIPLFFAFMDKSSVVDVPNHSQLFVETGTETLWYRQSDGTEYNLLTTQISDRIVSGTSDNTRIVVASDDVDGSATIYIVDNQVINITNSSCNIDIDTVFSLNTFVEQGLFIKGYIPPVEPPAGYGHLWVDGNFQLRLLDPSGSDLNLSTTIRSINNDASLEANGNQLNFYSDYVYINNSRINIENTASFHLAPLGLPPTHDNMYGDLWASTDQNLYYVSPDGTSYNLTAGGGTVPSYIENNTNGFANTLSLLNYPDAYDCQLNYSLLGDTLFTIDNFGCRINYGSDTGILVDDKFIVTYKGLVASKLYKVQQHIEVLGLYNNNYINLISFNPIVDSPDPSTDQEILFQLESIPDNKLYNNRSIISPNDGIIFSRSTDYNVINHTHTFKDNGVTTVYPITGDVISSNIISVSDDEYNISGPFDNTLVYSEEFSITHDFIPFPVNGQVQKVSKIKDRRGLALNTFEVVSGDGVISYPHQASCINVEFVESLVLIPVTATTYLLPIDDSSGIKENIDITPSVVIPLHAGSYMVNVIFTGLKPDGLSDTRYQLYIHKYSGGSTIQDNIDISRGYTSIEVDYEGTDYTMIPLQGSTILHFTESDISNTSSFAFGIYREGGNTWSYINTLSHICKFSVVKLT